MQKGQNRIGRIRNYWKSFVLTVLVIVGCSKNEIAEPVEKDCTSTEVDEQILEELNTRFAHEITSSDPEQIENLAPLIDYLGSSKVVGLGEGSHGSAEFYEMKDKIFRELVLQKDFGAIIYEIPWGHAMGVNDYVLNGLGSADEAVNETWYWVFDTQETRDLVEWMRAYNANRPEPEKIYFLGCDPQGPHFEIEKSIVKNFIEKTAPGFYDTVYLNYLDLPKDLRKYNSVSKPEQEVHANRVDYIYHWMDANREALVSLSSRYEYEVALMAAHVIVHRLSMYQRQSFGQTRDSLMAIYTEWWQQVVRPNAKVAVSAHNLHVMDNTNAGSQWMGSYLRKAYRTGYKNVCFSMGSGSLNAFLANGKGDFLSSVRSQMLDKTPCSTINSLLTRANPDQFYIIFNELKWPAESRLYFEKENRFFQTGAGFNPLYIHNYISKLPLARYFDVLIHFDVVRASELK